MYTISRGPSKIVAKTRRGLAQKLEGLETIRDMSRKNSDSEEVESPGSASSCSPPRPVFHPVNGKRDNTSQRQRPEQLSRQEEELIRYIYESWQRVHQDIVTSSESPSSPGGSSVTYYRDASPNPALENFEPFDLESWWGRRLYHTLMQST